MMSVWSLVRTGWLLLILAGDYFVRCSAIILGIVKLFLGSFQSISVI